MMNQVIDRLAEIIAAPPAILPATVVAARKPARGDDVPAIAAALALEQETGYGRWNANRGDTIREVHSFNGLLTLEVWATTFEQVNNLCRQVQTRLAASATPLRQKGFLLLQPARLDPAENALHVPASGSSFPVWRQKLAYRFAFEAEEAGELPGGGPIKRIDVDVEETVVESFAIGSSDV